VNMSQKIVSVEARRSPRYVRQLNVDVDGLEIVTTNVALYGVQLCCPQMRYKGFLRAKKDGETRLRIRIPGTRKWLTATGDVRYANPSEDDYLIGFQFTGIDTNSENQWTVYIRSLSEATPSG